MCFQPKDNTAKIMRQQEDERQQNILRGTDRINATFRDFGDDYYKQREKDYNAYYMPQVEQQGRDANDQLTYALARGGNLDSSTGAKQAGRLSSKINDARAQVAEGAFGASSDARNAVESNRTTLQNMLQNGSNLSNVANSAANYAEALTKPPAYSPLTDLFANSVGMLNNSVAFQQQGYPGWSITKPRASGGSSVKTVGG